MIRKIYKGTIGKGGVNPVHLPAHSKILRVDLQNGEWVFWYEFDTALDNGTKREQIIHIYGTGHTIVEENIEYINTFFQEEFVWHAYVEKEQFV